MKLMDNLKLKFHFNPVWSTSYTKRQAEEIQSRLALILRRSVYFRRYLDMLSAHPMVGLSTSQQIIVRDNVTAKEYHSACQAIIAFWVGKAGENAQIGSLLRVLEQIGWNSAKGEEKTLKNWVTLLIII